MESGSDCGEAHETAKAHHGVCDTAGRFVDYQMVDLAELLVTGPVHLGSVDVFA
jgi:hypothetical protein